MRWYYVDGKDRKGPFEESAFQKLVDEGKIGAGTLVWHDGMMDWQAYGQLAGAAPSPPGETAGAAKCSQCGNTFPEADLIRYQNLRVCAGCKPLFFQKIKEGVRVSSASASDRYGSIEKGINGDYDFTISEILKEAWTLMKGAKRYILGGTIIMYIILFAFGALMAVIQGVVFGSSHEHMAAAAGFQFLTQLVSMAISYPMTAGIMMIGIRRSVGLPIDLSLLFGYFGRVIPLVLMSLLSMVLVVIGFLLLVIPGIYLGVSYIMAMPLVVEKNLGPWRALETSRKAVTKKWFSIFGLFFVIGLISMVSMIPLGIGLIWTIPMASLAFGILYRTIFGVEELME